MALYGCYGQFKYGQAGYVYGALQLPFAYQVYILDEQGNKKYIINQDIAEINWTYNRIGGCGTFTIKLHKTYDDLIRLYGDYEVQIHCIKEKGQQYEKWFSGYIEEKSPVLDVSESISITGMGYVGQLDRIVVEETYTSTEISLIVKNILDNYIVPNTSISYDSVDIEATGYTIDSISFKNNARECIQTLGEIAGMWEWGVNKDKKFFFKASSDTLNHSFFVQNKIRFLDQRDDWRGIINRIYLEGGTVGGTKYTRTLNDAGSQSRWGLRERIMINTNITTDSVADKWGTSIFSEKSVLDRRATLIIVGERKPIEETVPLGRLSIRKAKIKYGTFSGKKYGQFRYQGDYLYQIDRVNYTINDNGVEMEMVLGRAEENIAKQLYQIEYNIKHLTNR